MNAIRESVRAELDSTFAAEERARIREEQGLESEEEGEEKEGPDPVPAITRAHFEVSGPKLISCCCPYTIPNNSLSSLRCRRRSGLRVPLFSLFCFGCLSYVHAVWYVYGMVCV